MRFSTHDVAFAVSGSFAFWATFFSIYLIYKHFRNYTQPNLQRYIVRILLMVPIYSIDSFLSLRFHEYALFFDLVRDSYEAYVIYCFFKLLEEFLGGEEYIKTKILANKEPNHHPWPLGWLPTFSVSGSFFWWSKISILQFTVVKPVLSLTSIIFEALKIYNDGSFSPTSGYLYETILDNTSITIAMYFLVLFYHATDEELAPLKPLGKFLTVKAVIFFSFWQSVIIAGLSYENWIKQKGSWTSEDVATGLQNFLICGEMYLVALSHLYVFSHKDFADPKKKAKASFATLLLKGQGTSAMSPLIVHALDTVNPTYDMQDAFGTVAPIPDRLIVKPLENVERRIRNTVQLDRPQVELP